MFEAENIDIISRMLQYKQDFLNYKVILHCRICKKRIPTVWNGYTIDGNFIANDAFWSEVLDTTVYEPDGIVCYDCLNDKQRRLARFSKTL